jgi:hypothetical protein
MSSPLLNMSSVLMCQHGGHCQPTSISQRVTLSGAPCLRLGDQMPIVGCVPPSLPGIPLVPCMSAQGITGTARIRSMGQPILTLQSTVLTQPTGRYLPSQPVRGRLASEVCNRRHPPSCRNAPDSLIEVLGGVGESREGPINHWPTAAARQSDGEASSQKPYRKSTERRSLSPLQLGKERWGVWGRNKTASP